MCIRDSLRAMELALKDAGIEKNKIEYINAHGTSTPANDKNETLAIKELFAEHAYDLQISSSKSMTGHLLGGAGAFESMVCLLSLKNNKISPTINLNTPDEECDLNYTPNIPLDREISYAMSNSFGFGGHNGVLIFGKN